MPDSTTPNYGWAYPTVNADANTWGTTLNNAIVSIDAQMAANAGAAAQKSNNLSDLANAATARANLGLGSAATSATSAFDAAGAASAAQSAAQASSCQRASNLADVASASSARANLGLGSGAIQNHTVSTSGPSGGSDGDTWDQVAS